MTRLLACALAGALLATATSSAAAAPRDCQRQGERVVARSAEAVVVRDRVKRRMVFTACATASGRRSALGVASSGRRGARTVGPFAVAGPYVAWGTSRTAQARAEAAELHVRDVRRPRRTRTAALPSELPVREVAVDTAGRTAALTEVEALVLDGDRLRRVDAGARGTLSGLRIDGADAVWSHAGIAQRAPLVLPFGPCAPEPAAFAPIAGPHAVLAQRTSGLAATSRIEVIACLREGPGAGTFFAIGEERGALAGTVAAALLPQPDGAYAISAVDLVTRAAIGVPVPVDRDFDPWALAGDGTIVALRGGVLVAHLPDSRAVELAPDARGTRFVLIDDLQRTAVWDRGSTLLP